VLRTWCTDSTATDALSGSRASLASVFPRLAEQARRLWLESLYLGSWALGTVWNDVFIAGD
jgi:hypothetical protein